MVVTKKSSKKEMARIKQLWVDQWFEAFYDAKSSTESLKNRLKKLILELPDPQLVLRQDNETTDRNMIQVWLMATDDARLAEKDRWELLCDLEKQGVDLMRIDEHHKCLLHYAITFNQMETLTQMLSRSEVVQQAKRAQKEKLQDRTTLYDLSHDVITNCIISHNCKALQLVVESGFDVNAEGYRLTPVAAAVHLANKEMLEFLFEKGATPHAPSGYASYPHLAIANGNLEILKILLNHHDEGPDARDPLDQTLLHIATRRRQQDILEFLIDRGYDPDAKDSKGETPMEQLAAMGPCSLLTQIKERVLALREREVLNHSLENSAVECDIRATSEFGKVKRI